MKLGIEKKERGKVYFLVAVVVAGCLYNFWPDSSSSPTTTSVTKPRAAATAVPEAASESLGQRKKIGGRVAGDFRPKLRDPRPENRKDLTKIDPTINLMLLARVQSVTLEGGSRNIFQFGAAPPLVSTAPMPKVAKILPGQQAAVKPPPPMPTGPPPDPVAPPIPFKYYGYSSIKGEPRKRVFFLDGEDVIVVWEGDMIKNRYKVIHVGLRSVEMEDTQFKNAKQQLPLAEELAG